MLTRKHYYSSIKLFLRKHGNYNTNLFLGKLIYILFNIGEIKYDKFQKKNSTT